LGKREVSIRPAFAGVRTEACVLIHEVVRGHLCVGDLADPAQHWRWWKPHAGRVALHGADRAGTAQPDQLGEPLVGEPVQAAILFERHEPRNCGQFGHLVNH